MSLDIEHTETGGTTVIKVKGEVDLYTSPDLRNVILEAVQASEDGVALYRGAVGSMEARVFPAARRFRELGVATGQEIGMIEPVETTPRALTPPEPLDPEE